MSNIEEQCKLLDYDIDELKAEILGEFVCNDDEDKINQLIDLAMALGEAYVYRDNIVTRKPKTECVYASRENEAYKLNNLG